MKSPSRNKKIELDEEYFISDRYIKGGIMKQTYDKK